MFDHLSQGRWWDIGLDLVTGCTPVSPGCANCWSAGRAHRAGCQKNPKMKARYGGLTDAGGNWTGEVRPQWQDLYKIGRARKPQIYTFWNDLFHEDIPFDLITLVDEGSFIDEVMIKIIAHPQHFYIICTKRPERALQYFLSRQQDFRNWTGAREILSRRLMIITTAENQEMADLRLPILLQIPGVLHGLSYEPALGAISFRWATWEPVKDGLNTEYDGLRKLDWLIMGGETGSHARPMHPDWVRSARDQAVAAGVPFFFKSWGEWAPFQDNGSLPKNCSYISLDGIIRPGDFEKDTDACMGRVGKKAAGRILDDRTWGEVPKL